MMAPDRVWVQFLPDGTVLSATSALPLGLDAVGRIEYVRIPLCSVCAGTGKPVSGIHCICDGKGTQQAELQGFRERCHDLESKLATTEYDLEVTRDEMREDR